MGNKAPKIRVNVRADKLTVKTRTERTIKVGQLLQAFPLYQSHPPLKEALDALLRDGTALKDAEDQVTKDEAQAAKSRGLRDDRVHAFDRSYDVAVSLLEKHAQTAGDVESAGFLAGERTSHPLVPPLGLTAAFNYTTNRLEIRVKRAKGMTASYVEISPDPVGHNTYKRLDGISSFHEVAGYAPGTYWLRAASVRGQEVSAWIGPVSVLIK